MWVSGEAMPRRRSNALKRSWRRRRVMRRPKSGWGKRIWVPAGGGLRPPLPENLLLGLHRKLPSAPPASTQEVSESENRPATRGTAHPGVQGDSPCRDRRKDGCNDRRRDRCSDRPIAALHFLPPV